MSRKNEMKNWTVRAGLLLCVMVLAATAHAQAAGPAITASTLTTIPTTGIANPPETVVQDSCGDFYVLDEGGDLWELPASSGTATSVNSYNTGGYANQALAVDSNNNLYITSPNYAGDVLRIPSSNCVPQPSAASNIAAPGATQGYFYFAEGIAIDSSNNLFIIGSNDQIMEYTSTGTLSTLLTTSCLPTSIAVDAGENLYFTCGANPAASSTGNGNSNSGVIYQLANSSGSYATAAVTFAPTSLTNAYGLTFDKLGNLYVVDQGTGILYEIPVSPETGALAPSLIFPVSASPAAGYRVTAGNDGKTLLYAPVYSASSNLYEMRPGPVDFGSVALGSTATVNVNLSFYNAIAPAAIATTGASGVFTNNGTGSCAATSYGADSNCTVNITFAPTSPGRQSGSILLLDSNGNQLATADISGTGTGAAVSVDPGVVSTFGSGYTAPTSVAIDNEGDVFFADSSQNAILEVPAGSATTVALGTGFNAPTGVAVDGAGNVYVADTGNSRIVEIPVVNGVLSTSAQETLIASGTSIAGMALSDPAGIAIDAFGDLYIADSGNKRVVYVPYVGSWDWSLAVTPGSGMTNPSAIAVDPSGDVYVADAGNGKVYELTAPLSTAVQVTVASGYSQPSGLAVDASGSLFVVDRGNAKVWRIPDLSGTLAATSAVNVTGQLNAGGTAIIADPYGVAIGPSGNLYVSDDVNAAAYIVSRSSSTQSFGTWNPDTTSGTLTYYLENSGNASLTLGSPFYTASGNTAQFSILSGAAGVCSNSATVAVGSSCDLNADFSPTGNANYTDTLTLSSNAYVSGQQLVFTGAGTATTPTTTVLAVTSPSGSPSYDQAVTLTATVQASGGTPAGSVNLLVDGITEQTVALNANGIALFTLPAGMLSGGSHALQANYLGGVAGSVTFSQSSSTTVTVNVLPVASSAAVSFTTLYDNPVSQPEGSPITFTATISSAYAGVPTGTVTFTVMDSSGTLATGTGTLEPASGGTFQATYTYANSTSPAGGAAFDAQSVVATYTGDIDFTGSTSASSSFDVSPMGGSVQVMPSGTSLTTGTSGGSSTISFTATSYGGWEGLVGFSCLASSLPANATCVFSPGQTQITASTAASPAQNAPVSMSVAIDQPPQTPTASGFLWWLAGPAGLLLFFTRRRFAGRLRTPIATIAALVLLGIAGLGLGACGSSPQNLTPAGTSTVTVYVWSQPFTAPPSTSNANPPTQTCGINPITGKPDPSLAPCSQTTYQVSLTVK